MATQSENSEKWIDTYANLQRIKSAPDQAEEIEYQLSIAKAHLESLGIPTENLDRK